MEASEPRGRVGTLVAGKWHIDERIGSGGMATVYSATHRNGMRAALKMLHSPLSRDPSTRARFLREGYVANSVGHDGVVAVLDDGVTEDGSAFLVLELLEGETIDERRHRLGGSIPVPEALDIALQTLAALAAAHEKGIVHRDVKPENVFITKENKIKILDFGLAHMKDAQGEVTKTGVTIGTPEFMPPEQAQGRRDKVDPRSDVWMVGATLFTIISGKFVHDDAETIHEALIASATRRPRPIRELAPHLSPAIANVIDRALELEMTDRWESAAHMRAALIAAQTTTNRGTQLDSETALAMPATSRSSSPGRAPRATGVAGSDPRASRPPEPRPPPVDPEAEWRRRAGRPVPTDDTMPDSVPEVNLGSGEVDLEATHYDPGRQASRPAAQATPRMQSRPYRAPIQTPSEEHLTHNAPPRSVPPRALPPSTHEPVTLAAPPRSVPPPSHHQPQQQQRGSMPPPSMPPPSMPPPPSSMQQPMQPMTPRAGSVPPRSPNLTPIHDAMEPTPIFAAGHRPPMPSLPPSQSYAPAPPQSMPPRRQGQNPRETIALVALALFFLCAAMGAYMMRRR